MLVSGVSYGGYMSLAVATNYGDRIRASINVVGISYFVTLLENTEDYRRDLRRVEYGDERDPKMRQFLTENELRALMQAEAHVGTAAERARDMAALIRSNL